MQTSAPQAPLEARETSPGTGWIGIGSALAALALGRALEISNGNLHPDSVFWLTLTLLVSIAAVAAPRPWRMPWVEARLLPFVAIAGIFLQMGQLFTTLPGMYLRLTQPALVSFYWGLVAVAVAAAAAVWAPPRSRGALVVALVAAHFLLGVWMLRHSPSPVIDVFVFQRDASIALGSGQGPYGMTFPDIYGNSPFYGPGMSVNGRLQFGFPYPPLSLLLVAPAQWLAGDPRYAQLVAIELAALLMAFARPGRAGALAAALFLTTPRILFVLEQAWTEPLIVLGVAATAFAALRFPRARPWTMGAFLALKQYLVLALPAALLLERWPLRGRPWLASWSRAAAVVAATLLPFVVWEPVGFFHSVVTLQLYQPFRREALSYLAWWAAQGGGQIGAWVSLIAAALAAALALWRAPRNAAGFAAGLALTLLAFFAFNKQAFCNYYFLVIGALCVALATGSAGSEEPA